MTDPDPQSSPSFPSANGHHDDAAALVGPVEADRPAPRPLHPADSPVPFQDLRIPVPSRAAPPLGARVAAFAGILVGGLLGGLISSTATTASYARRAAGDSDHAPQAAFVIAVASAAAVQLPTESVVLISTSSW